MEIVLAKISYVSPCTICIVCSKLGAPELVRTLNLSLVDEHETPNSTFSSNASFGANNTPDNSNGALKPTWSGKVCREIVGGIIGLFPSVSGEATIALSKATPQRIWNTVPDAGDNVASLHTQTLPAMDGVSLSAAVETSSVSRLEHMRLV